MLTCWTHDVAQQDISDVARCVFCAGPCLRRMDALRQNDFEAYKELLRQTHGPQTDEDRFKGESHVAACLLAGLHVCIYYAPCSACGLPLAQLRLTCGGRD
jgi:hypothetical protein